VAYRDPVAPPADARLPLRDQAELLEDADTVVQADFLGDESVLHADHGRPGEVHGLARGHG